MNRGEICLTHWLYASCIVVSDPDVPTLRGAANVQQTSVSLEWNFGATAVVSSSVVHYVDVSSTTSRRQTTEMTERLTGLTPGHTYVYYLCVRSFDKTACSTNYTVTTRE